jgi:predicted Zn-dependent protease
LIKGSILFFFLTICIATKAQYNTFYNFQKDDTILKKKYVDEAFQQKNLLIASLGNEYKNDYIKIYDNRYKEVERLIQSTSVVTAPEVHHYLFTILQKVIDCNKELRNKKIRLVFSRDRWPNAYSMGEGTLVINAGLMVFLDNEAEMVFILCHELAHFYLDHGNRSIRKNIERFNSEEYKAEIKRLSKKEYRVNEQLDSLVKKIAFGSRKHDREYEAEADRYAFEFMKKTGYDCNAIVSCLRLLEKIDASSIYQPLNVEAAFNFIDYPFKKRWIKSESAIFSQMNTDLSVAEKNDYDSLKTHPDCQKRISLIQDSVSKHPAGKKFMVDELFFKQLKKDFVPEMAEQDYRNENLSSNLYYNLLMLQSDQDVALSIYSVARALNKIYDNQKNHLINGSISKEHSSYANDYNLLLRMFDRLKLEEVSNLSYHFCKLYADKMKRYPQFENELKKTEKNIQ